MSAEQYESGHNTFDDKTLEKGPTERIEPADDRYHFDQSDLDRVQRRLKQRHVQMFVLCFFLAHMSIAHRVDTLSIVQDCCSCPPLVVGYSQSLTISLRSRGPLGRVCSLGLGRPFRVQVLWAHCSRISWLARLHIRASSS